MKLRIKGNSIRLRLSQSEVSDFEKSGSIEERTIFPSGSALVYTLARGDHDEFQVELAGSNVIISVPHDIASKWCQGNEVGMDSFIPLTDDQTLRVLIEKDFACLTDRDHEDESDNFPNPNVTC